MPTRKDKTDGPASKGVGRKKSKPARKPSFSMGGAVPVEQRTGWVYRSEQATQAQPAATPPTPPESQPRHAPAPAPAPSSGGGWGAWLQEGAEAALLPFQVALVVALAPVQWLTSRGATKRK